jgi:hypothetical protein
VEARVREAQDLPLAWLEIMQVVSATGNCRVLDIAKALSITVGGRGRER